MVQLKITKLKSEDFGKGIAKISRNLMDQYNYDVDEIIEVIGNKRTGVKIRPFDEKEVIDESVIMLDGLTRTSIGATLDSTIRIDKTISQTANKVVLAPINPTNKTKELPSYKFQALLGVPISSFDVVAINSADIDLEVQVPIVQEESPEESQIEIRHDNGMNVLGEVRFIIKETVPSGIVIISEDTEFVLEATLPEKSIIQGGVLTYDDIGGFHRILQRLHEIAVIPLRNPQLFRQLNIDFPKGVLITGSSGIGKSLIARVVTQESGAYIVPIRASEIVSGHFGEAEKRLRKYFREAQSHAPSIIIVDDLDTVAPIRNPMITPELSRRLTSEFLVLIDQIPRDLPVLLIATSNNREQIDPGFKRPGRFDHEISLGPPDRSERKEILIVKTRGVPIHPNVDLKELGERTRGYSGADLNMLVKESALAAVRKIIPQLEGENTIPSHVFEALTLKHDDFNEALKYVNPSSMKEIFTDIPEVTWDDIGGLDSTKQKIIESVEWPLKNPEIYTNMGVKPPSGVLLYGPPGTGKTLVAKAIANATHSNFIAVRGPELNSKWFGETERAIREIFRKAREVAPSLIFFDEIDSMIRIRGSSTAEPWIDRMINQFLTEMDGIDKKGRMIVIGATNRPELLDPAILRPGRFDRLIYVPVPDLNARLEIFKVHTKNMNLASNVDLSELASKTEYFVGADIENLCREAAILCLRENMDNKEVNQEFFLAALKTTQPTMNKDTTTYFDNLSSNLRGNINRRDRHSNRDYFS